MEVKHPVPTTRDLFEHLKKIDKNYFINVITHLVDKNMISKELTYDLCYYSKCGITALTIVRYFYEYFNIYDKNDKISVKLNTNDIDFLLQISMSQKNFAILCEFEDGDDVEHCLVIIKGMTDEYVIAQSYYSQYYFDPNNENSLKLLTATEYEKFMHKCKILLNNRRINAENYEKTIIRGNRMLEMNYNKEFADKYKLGIISDDDLIDKLNEKDKYKDLIHHTIALKIREQYKKVPIKQYIKTYIFDQIVSDLDIIYEHNSKDDKTKNIKDIQSIEKAIIDHCKSNVDKIKQNNNMINNSEFGLVIIDYEIDIPEGTTIFTKNRIQKLLYLLNR